MTGNAIKMLRLIRICAGGKPIKVSAVTRNLAISHGEAYNVIMKLRDEGKVRTFYNKKCSHQMVEIV